MKWFLGILVVLLVGRASLLPDRSGAMSPGGQQAAAPAQPGFRVFDVFVDSGEVPLAAYQVEVVGAGAQLVGVEGGEHAAFAEPPFYDPAALHGEGGERIVLAGLSTAAELPSGRTRVARLHLRAEAGVQFVTEVEAAGTRGGGRIDIRAEVVPVQ